METVALRFADILSTASAVANYRGEPEVVAAHLLDAIDVLADRKTMEDLGRPQSPLVAAHRPQAVVVQGVQDLVRRWFAELNGDINAELTGESLDRFIADLRTLAAGPA